MTKFEGFPTGTKSLPVPSLLLGSLLAKINDIAELKCILRLLWYTAQVSGSPKWVEERTLLSDSVLNEALGSQAEIRRGVAAALARGTLIGANSRLLIATPENRRSIAAITAGLAKDNDALGPVQELTTRETPNVYALYEANIGILTPMVADHLRDAEATYPLEWIEAAIREATESNARSWRYMSTILERWSTEGRQPRRGRGTPRGNGNRGQSAEGSETLTAAEYVNRFGMPPSSGGQL
jgi:DnaD/phage-associated family protein